ncbi:hypothetical protein AB0D13_09020 [Streptomyces sp. NPDC048430]|uniref:hypothetical protein n=1 Tax=Streptomyces sp. NPDC048430 TaxID=3155388 RepID=UPI0034496FBA
MYRVMLLKTATRVHVTRAGFGVVGRITRVMPHLGMYHVRSEAGNTYPVRIRGHHIETI